MPQDLRVVPWEQFNSYHEEILEKIDRVPGFDAEDSGKVLTVSASDDTAFLDGAEPQSSGGGADLPTFDWSDKNKVLSIKENASGDGELGGNLIQIEDCYGGQTTLPDIAEEDGDYVLTLMTGGSQKIEGKPAPDVPTTEGTDPEQVLMTTDLGTEGRTVNFVPDYSDIGTKTSLITDGDGNIQGGNPLPDYSFEDINSALVINNDYELEWKEVIPRYQDWDAGKFLAINSTGDSLQGITIPQIPTPDGYNDRGKILVVDQNGQFVLMDGLTYSSMYIDNN